VIPLLVSSAGANCILDDIAILFVKYYHNLL
jgi:hypothetical protein